MASRKRRKRAPQVGRDALKSAEKRKRSNPKEDGKKRSDEPKSSSPKKSAAQRSSKRATQRRVKQKSRSRSARKLVPADSLVGTPQFWIGVAFLTATIVYAFWPTFQWLEQQWRTEPDYSHGYIVIPLALILLRMRWDWFPGIQSQVDWRGLSLIAVAVVMRVVGRLAYMDFLDGWALVPMVAGIVWLLFGLPALRWAAPAIAFLIMLVPLPYRAESLLSWNLQGTATTVSTAMLRILGQPAIAEGHTIWVGETQMSVARACSGLRIFVGMFALAFFWSVTVRRSWMDRVVILMAALPMALLANSLRITAITLLYGNFDNPGTRHLIHDTTGYMMIPLGAFLLWCVKAYWEKLYRPLAVHNPAERLSKKPVAG